MASVNRSSGLQWSWLVLSVAGELLNALTWKEVVSNQVQLIFHPAHPAPTTLTSPSSPLPLLFHSTCACPHPPSLPLHGLSISQFQSGRAISPAITTLSRPLLPHPLSLCSFPSGPSSRWESPFCGPRGDKYWEVCMGVRGVDLTLQPKHRSCVAHQHSRT